MSKIILDDIDICLKNLNLIITLNLSQIIDMFYALKNVG